jgi:hypothetical protein
MEPMQKEEGGIGCCQRALAHPRVNDQRLADKKQHQRGIRWATSNEHYSSATSNASFLMYGCTLARDTCTCEPLTTRTVLRPTSIIA